MVAGVSEPEQSAHARDSWLEKRRFLAAEVSSPAAGWFPGVARVSQVGGGAADGVEEGPLTASVEHPPPVVAGRQRRKIVH